MHNFILNDLVSFKGLSGKVTNDNLLGHYCIEVCFVLKTGKRWLCNFTKDGKLISEMAEPCLVKLE